MKRKFSTSLCIGLLSFSMQTKIYACIVKVGPRMTPQAVSNTIYALSQMGFQWQDICSDARSTLVCAIMRQHNHFNQQGLSMTLFSLGRMNVINSMGTLSDNNNDGINYASSSENDEESFLPLLVDALVKKGPKMDAQQLANSLHGLGRLSILVGPSMNSLTQQSLLSAAASTSDVMTEQELGNTVWGLGQIGTQFSRAPRTVVYKLYKNRHFCCKSKSDTDGVPGQASQKRSRGILGHVPR